MNGPTPQEIFVERDVMIAMRDGVRLACDIYRPHPAPALPALLERTPYDKLGTNHADRTRAVATPVSRAEIARRLAQAGYVVVVQDCRGRYGSEGSFRKYLNEAEDGVDTIAWIAAQAWCDGRVGTYGLSYGAHVQAAAACLAPAGLAAMFLDSGGFSSAYHSGIRQGGAFELKQATWAFKHALLSPAVQQDPALRQTLEAQDIRAWFTRLPWGEGDSPLSAAPEYEAYLLEQWRRGLFDDYWRQLGIYARGSYEAFADVPMVHMASWFDPYALTATENYVGLSRAKSAAVKLVLGPWTHGQRSVSYAGDVDFGPEAPLDGALASDYVALRRRWFDWSLKGKGADPLPDPVTIFVMGGGSGRRTAEGRIEHGGEWRGFKDWPVPDAEATPFYLTGDGGLGPAPSNDESAYLEYVHDPAHPVPTIGGATASGAPVMVAGSFDQVTRPETFGATAPFGPLADRPDVLVFQTPPLAEELVAIGPLEVCLWVGSDARDTDFHVKLIDVHPPSPDWPEGFAMNLSHGVLRARYREGFDREAWLEPDGIYPLCIRMFPTANRFSPGHRLRLDVSSSNFPHFDVNPGSGEPEGYAEAPVVARNRVYMDATRPSHLLLPLVPAERRER